MFNSHLSETTRVSRYQKGKTSLDFTEARDSKWQWHQLGHVQVCTSLRQITTPTPHRSIFTARYWPWACVCLSVSVRLCLSQVGVLLKRQNVGSHKQHHTIPQESSFLTPKISAKFDLGHPLRGRRMQVPWVKIGDFRQTTGYISRTAQDRHIVPIKVEYEVV